MGKLFFSDAKAKGAFFGLTLLFLVPWLLVTLFAVDFVLLLMNGHSVAPFIVLGVIFFPLLLCYLYGVWLASYGLFANHATLPGNRQWGKIIGGAVALLLGASLLVFLYSRAFQTFLNALALKSPEDMLHLPDFLEAMLGGPWCLLFVVLAVVLLAVGYLVLGKVLAERGKVPFAQLWTKGVRAQWYAMLAIYVVSLCLAGVAAVGLHGARQEIARAAGRPMTAQAMEEYYCDGQRPDGEFWQRVVKASEARGEAIRRATSEDEKSFIPQMLDSSQNEMPPEMIARWREIGLDIPETRDFEAFFDKPLPPNARNYVEGNLVAVRLPELALCREVCRLESWRIRMAVADNDFATAQAALNRLGNVRDRLAHDNFQICAMVWGTACETRRCEALAQVIGAGMGDEEWLKAIDEEMVNLEKSMDGIRLNAMIYGEATTWADTADGCWNGSFANFKGAVPMNALKWVTPQLWWCFVRDKEVMTKYLADGLDKPLEMPNHRSIGLVAILGAISGFERKWLDYKTNYRLVRALIAIELEKRRIGDWPSQPDVELPEDPFAPGCPLKFQYGELEIYRPVWNDEMNYFNKRTETVKGLRVYSVGRNGNDDGGIPRNSSGADDLGLWFPVP